MEKTEKRHETKKQNYSKTQPSIPCSSSFAAAVARAADTDTN